ncbi:MAG: 30S ribosomal protein S3ae [Euryarchaeota archaeon]|nr:30S ribosomal protein S3ae [Euryarchaeota archaeon]
MAKARSRSAARKIKDKWKAKSWYQVQAPAHFGNAALGETVADEQQKLIGRVSETTLQELTGDFKQMHVKLAFKINEIQGTIAKTDFVGHSLTSDYIRRMTRRNHSKIDAVVDAVTKDGAKIRVKPFAVSDKRTKTAQEAAVRQVMVDEIMNAAKEVTLNRFVRNIVDGQVAARIFKSAKPIYPVRRVEVNKTQVLRAPQVEIEEDWAAEFAEPESEPTVEETETPTEAAEGEAAEESETAESAEEAPETEAEAEPEAEAETEAEETEKAEAEVTAEAKE